MQFFKQNNLKNYEQNTTETSADTFSLSQLQRYSGCLCCCCCYQSVKSDSFDTVKVSISMKNKSRYHFITNNAMKHY